MMKRIELNQDVMEQVNGGGLYILDAFDRAAKKAAFEYRMKEKNFSYY